MTKLLQLLLDSGEYGFKCPKCNGWLRYDSKKHYRNDKVPEEELEFLDDFLYEAQLWSLVCKKCSWKWDWWMCSYLRPPYIRLGVYPAFDGDLPLKLKMVYKD